MLEVEQVIGLFVLTEFIECNRGPDPAPRRWRARREATSSTRRAQAATHPAPSPSWPGFAAPSPSQGATCAPAQTFERGRELTLLVQGCAQIAVQMRRLRSEPQRSTEGRFRSGKIAQLVQRAAEIVVRREQLRIELDYAPKMLDGLRSPTEAHECVAQIETRLGRQRRATDRFVQVALRARQVAQLERKRACDREQLGALPTLCEPRLTDLQRVRGATSSM